MTDRTLTVSPSQAIPSVDAGIMFFSATCGSPSLRHADGVSA